MASRVGRLALVTLVAVATVSVTVGTFLSAAGVSAAEPERPGVPVSPADQVLLATAAQACPTLTPARLAGQIMANSGFDPSSTLRPGRTGLAGLTDAQWRRWAPDPAADRMDRTNQLTALAHLMCDLVEQVRLLSPAGDEWRLALAAFLVGPGQVAVSGGVPEGDAADYVQTVVAYANWYAGRLAYATPAGAGFGVSTPTPSPTTGSATTTAAPTQPGGEPTLAPGARDAYVRIEAEHYDAEQGTAVEDCRDDGGGANVGQLAPGDWLRYDRLDFGAAPATWIVLRYAGDLPAGMVGTIEVRLDSPVAPRIGEVTVTGTGGWQAWTTVVAGLAPVTGVHDVYLTVASSNGWEIGNLNWFVFGR